jgi:cell division protein FtsZ
MEKMVERVEKGMSPSKNTKMSLRIIGVGGCGVMALTCFSKSGIEGDKIIAIDADHKELETLKTGEKFSVQPDEKKGLDGPSPEALFQKVAKERGRIIELLEGTDVVILVAGMGGKIGTVVSPLIAKIAREMGLFTMGVVSTPFRLEGKYRHSKGRKGLESLREQIDSLIVIGGDSIVRLTGKEISFIEALHTLDESLSRAVEEVYYLFLPPEDALICDGYLLKELLEGERDLRIGLGTGKGEDAILKAIKKAVSSPLLDEKSPGKARKLVASITCGSETSLDEIRDAASLLEGLTGDDTEVALNTRFLPELKDESRAALIL